MSSPGRRRPAAVRLYAAFTCVLPGELGRRYGEDAAMLFDQMHADAVREGGWIAGWSLWARSTVLLLACALRERREVKRTRGRGRRREPMRDTLHDIRCAIRTLWKRPMFALTATLILGVGVGATTGIFSVVDTVLLRPLPYPEAGRLVHFTYGAHSYPALRAWLGMSSFESVAAARDHDVDLTGGGTPERLHAVAVSPEFFPMLGGAPHLGRLFDAGDYPGDRGVVVLDHGFWTRRWGGDPDVVGSTLIIDGQPSVVVGVLDPAFPRPEVETGEGVDLWLALDDGGEEANEHGFHTLGVIGRLAPGASLEAAQAEVDAQHRAFAEELPQYYVSRDGTMAEVPLVPLRESTVRQVSATLLTLLGAVGLLLLIACANVANLFLAHGTARTREISLRAALGATRARLARQVLTESVLLALAGGALGVALALGGVELFMRYNPGGIPRIDALAVDVRVLAFSVLVSMLTGILFGMLPAVRAMHADVNDALKEGATAVTATRGARRLRSGLVVAEIALAVVLVTGAGLLARTLVVRAQVDPGFAAENLVVVPLLLGAEYDEAERRQFTDAFLEQVRAMPGVESAAAAWTTPFRRTGPGRCCWRTRIVGDPALRDEENPFRGIIHPVTPDYFGTLRAPLAAGREFSAADVEGGVAILNRPAALELFGTEQVVGRTLSLGSAANPVTLAVVGVNEGVHHFGPTEGVEGAVYVTYARFGTDLEELEILVRTPETVGTMADRLRQTIWSLDPDLPIPEVTTVEQRVAASLASPRFLAGLLGFFAAAALLLACGGVYGSMLYTVAQRRREMGIRLALGAGGPDVVRLVMGHGVVLALIGVTIGTLAALAVSGVMTAWLWGVEPTDPATYAAVALLLAAAAASAAFVPAWRAGRTDPLETLRAE
ncbi:MAG TPA: ABC transporter permease [Longimicrobiales bacterium]|nr:ABC transporter permease [Longimicrobiales bacterium]